jgi:hypothetical protein
MEPKIRTSREKFTRVGSAVKEFWYHLVLDSRMCSRSDPMEQRNGESNRANREAFKGTQVKNLDAVGTVKSDLLNACETYEALRS